MTWFQQHGQQENTADSMLWIAVVTSCWKAANVQVKPSVNDDWFDPSHCRLDSFALLQVVMHLLLWPGLQLSKAVKLQGLDLQQLQTKGPALSPRSRLLLLPAESQAPHLSARQASVSWCLAKVNSLLFSALRSTLTPGMLVHCHVA